jgi:hypothetical protein
VLSQGGAWGRCRYAIPQNQKAEDLLRVTKANKGLCRQLYGQSLLVELSHTGIKFVKAAGINTLLQLITANSL